MILFDESKTITFPTLQKEVYDVTGAGDTVISVLAASISSNKTLKKSCELANIAAGLSIQHLGTVSVSKADLSNAIKNPKLINNLNDLEKIVQRDQSNNKQIVFTNGCFDIIHPGHIYILEQAKSKGDILLVGLNSDKSVQRLKSSSRPVCSQFDRAYVLSGLSTVDYIFIFDEDTPEKLIQTICPDVLVKGKDYIGKFIAGEDFMLRNNKRVELVDMIDSKSTSSIIDKISKENPS